MTTKNKSGVDALSASLPQPLMFINGEWRAAADGRTREVQNPATERAITSVPLATPADLDAALGAADAGFRAWRRASAWASLGHPSTVRRGDP